MCIRDRATQTRYVYHCTRGEIDTARGYGEKLEQQAIHGATLWQSSIVVPLLTPLFNHDSPRLWGFPAFYWVQFLFILLGVATTSLVYRMTRR